MDVDTDLYIEELKAQRNAVLDQLAMAGARIVKLTKELAEAKALIDGEKKKE